MHTTHDEVELRLIVSSRVAGAEGVVVLDLRDPSGTDLPAWAPGAHIDLDLPNGLVRQYSLCGDPADRSVWQIGVLREPDGRGGSAYVHDQGEVDHRDSLLTPEEHEAYDTMFISVSRAASATLVLDL